MRSDWRKLSSQSRPSQRRSSSSAAAYSARDRSASVSSRRSRKVPPPRRASSQLTRAMRALPTCSRPVGDGAKRSFIGSLLVLAFLILVAPWVQGAPVPLFPVAHGPGGEVAQLRAAAPRSFGGAQDLRVLAEGEP